VDYVKESDEGKLMHSPGCAAELRRPFDEVKLEQNIFRNRPDLPQPDEGEP
jgi:hypothetical protein